MNFGLSLILLGFAYIQPGTLVTRRFASALLLLAIAFFASAYGPLMPRWATVIGTNMLLISAGVMLNTGFSAFCQQQTPKIDHFGWTIVALTAAPFWYWGLIEPNGNYRSTVFSFAVVLINGRTAYLLFRAALDSSNRLPIAVVGGLFAVLTVWMLARGITLLQAEPVAPEQRGANPTLWITVFWYIVLVALMTGCIIWMEINRLRVNTINFGLAEEAMLGTRQSMQENLILLWSTVVILCLAICAEVLIGYQMIYQNESERMEKSLSQANAALVEQASQLLKQVDLLLLTTRSYYQTIEPARMADVEATVLAATRQLSEEIYVFDDKQRWLNKKPAKALDPKVTDLEQHFNYHRFNLSDTLYFGKAKTVIMQNQALTKFAISRRINRQNNEFAGIILTELPSSNFTGFYQKLLANSAHVVSLLGVDDHLPRVQYPDSSAWRIGEQSTLWQALDESPSGQFLERLAIGKEPITQFQYQQIADLPLVMVNGYSVGEVTALVRARISPVLFGASLTIFTIITLALILSWVVRQREEQSQLLSMLSHELKTPLSLIRLALGSETLSPKVKQLAIRSVMDMNAVIERCLQTDRLYHGRVSITWGSCKLDEVLNELCAHSNAPERLSLNVAELPDCKTDPQILRVILSNLIDNALKYSPATQKVRIVAMLAPHHHQGGIMITVSNPLSPTIVLDASKIFRKYYRGETAHKTTGSGVGLYLAKHLAKAIGCQLSYSPNTCEANFNLWIPL